jgi:hypothetical protein
MTLVPPARPRNRNERLSRFHLIHEASPARWRESLPVRPDSAGLSRRLGRVGRQVSASPSGSAGAEVLIPLTERGEVGLLELLSGGRVNHPKVVQE